MGSLAVASVVPSLGELLDGGHRLLPLQEALRATAGAGFFGAGILRCARWRLTGEASNAYSGVALLLLGSLMAPLSLGAALTRTGPAELTVNPLTRILAAALAAIFVAKALRAAQVDTSVRPLLLSLSTVATGLGLVLAWLVVTSQASYDVEPGAAGTTALELAAAAMWAAFAWTTHRKPAGWRTSVHWSTTSLVLLASAEVARALAAGHPTPWALSGTCLTLAAAAAALTGATQDVLDAYGSTSRRLLSVTTDLADSEQLIEAEERQQRQLVHDARNVLTALRTASGTLERYEERLDEDTKHRLRSAITGELTRLQRLIDPDPAPATVEVALEEALHPVLMARPGDDPLAVRATVDGLRVRCSPDGLAGAVEHLLGTMRRHGCRSALVWAKDAGPDVQLYLEEADPKHRASVTAEVGLHTVRRLLRGTDCHVQRVERPGAGLAFALSLPAASPRVGEQPEQVVYVGGAGDPAVDLPPVDEDVPPIARLTGQDHDHPRGGPAGNVRGLVDDSQVHRRRLVARLRHGEPAQPQHAP